MIPSYKTFFSFLIGLSLISCGNEGKDSDLKIAYLHHSTGEVIWNGNSGTKGEKVSLPVLFNEYNKITGRDYYIKEIVFPKASPYGWNNYPYDYYNIWVKNAGKENFMEEPTLENLTKEYQVIVFKHCFPVSNIQEDDAQPDINSDKKTIANYKIQYEALMNKLHQFPQTKFILFTGAAQAREAITESEAQRAKEFFDWVKNNWDQAHDNIYLWDLYTLETQGGLYLKDEFAVSSSDSHPNKEFAVMAVRLLFNRIIDVIDNNGNGTTLIGEKV